MMLYLYSSLPLVAYIITLIWVIKSIPRKQLDLIINIFLVLAASVYAWFGTVWIFISLYAKYFLILFSLFSLFYILKKTKNYSLHSNNSKKIGFKIIVVLIFPVLIFMTFMSKKPPSNSIELSFPFHTGTYTVFQGGSNRLSNPLHRYSYTQSFAVDFVKVNRFGNRANGLYPLKLSSYSIFSDSVFAPCAGEIIEVAREFPDNKPPKVTKASLDNRVVIKRNDNIIIYMAHFKQSTIFVSVGDNVKPGQYIGCVGNSGMTCEPHLHIQANLKANSNHSIKGEPLPMLFNGIFFSTNTIFTSGGRL